MILCRKYIKQLKYEAKSINDNYGHLAGDQTIKSIGSILRDAIDTNAFAVRFAGDEFVIIATVCCEQDIQNILSAIQMETDQFNRQGEMPYQLVFSCGFAIYETGDNLDSFIKRMDREMYQQKMLHKRHRQSS